MAAKTADSTAATEHRTAMGERAGAHAELDHHRAAEAEKPPPLTHSHVAPGEREVFPPMKVGGTPDWPWHDDKAPPSPPPSFSQGECDYEFVAQINLEQLRDCVFTPPGLLPATGALYFFIQAGYDGEDFNPDEHILSHVTYYSPAADAPPWPAPLPHGAVDPADRELLSDTFGNMRSAFETYRSSALAPALDALTLPPFAKHQLMSDAWQRWVYGEVLSEDSEHDDWGEDDLWDAESEFIAGARELGPPCCMPMMLGHCVVPEAAVESWLEFVGDTDDSPVGEKIGAGQVCLLQVTPHGPGVTFVAFFASEVELRDRR